MVKTRICTAASAVSESLTQKTWSPGSLEKPLSKASQIETGLWKVNNPGKFGRFGGKYVPETLITCLQQLEAEFNFVLQDNAFQVEHKKINFIFV